MNAPATAPAAAVSLPRQRRIAVGHGPPRAVRWLSRSKAATIGGLILGLAVLAALLAPVISPAGYDVQDFSITLIPPFENWSYPLGTDQFGRDVLTRVLYGARVTLLVSLSGMLLATAVGVAAGLASGYLGGIVDGVVMRVADVQLSFPYMILAIALMALVGPSLPLLVVVLAARGWVNYARTVRGVTLSLREQEFVSAAVLAGATPTRIILRHLLPNALAPIIVLSSFELAAMMLVEASLSFLGLGVQPPMPSWGSMVSQARDYIYTTWWLATMPGLALMLAVLGANQLGDGLRDLLDPRLRGVRL